MRLYDRRMAGGAGSCAATAWRAPLVAGYVPTHLKAALLRPRPFGYSRRGVRLPSCGRIQLRVILSSFEHLARRVVCTRTHTCPVYASSCNFSPGLAGVLLTCACAGRQRVCDGRGFRARRRRAGGELQQRADILVLGRGARAAGARVWRHRGPGQPVRRRSGPCSLCFAETLGLHFAVKYLDAFRFPSGPFYAFLFCVRRRLPWSAECNGCLLAA